LSPALPIGLRPYELVEVVSADWLWLAQPAGRIQPLLKLPASKAL
jgi:hypothetical protein